MSGGAVAYHLRENKAIERNLFIELLSRIGRVENISDYTYVGFGGPFLEDFKALHASLRIGKMVSIEGNENVYLRQKFNCPANFIDVQHCRSTDFVRAYSFNEPCVVWLDYTDPKQLYTQLSEFREVLVKLGKFDVAKITLNANPSSLGGNQGGSVSHEERCRVLSERLADYCPAPLAVEDVFTDAYPNTLLRAIKSCVGAFATRAKSEYFQILSSFVYRDSGHQMLTVTGVILDASDDAEKAKFLEKSRVDHWPFRNLHWDAPTEISVPSLSAKERMRLDSVLPVPLESMSRWGDDLAKVLGYVPGDVGSKDLLANYARFYRAYPFFSKVVL